MAEDTKPFPLAFKPGVRRDGTRLETQQYRAAQHTRWHMGRARKMGGYRAITGALLDNPYTIDIYPKNDIGYTHVGCGSGLQQCQLAVDTGVMAALVDRTPAGYAANASNLWTMVPMYNAAAGSQVVNLIAHVAPNLASIDSATAGTIYAGQLDAATALTNITATGGSAWPPASPPVNPNNAPSVSGGICLIMPFLFAYGSDGFIAWCDTNTPVNWTGGSANNARICDKKIVYGTSARGGNVPSGLFWSLDSVIRATFVGGSAIFNFTTVTDKSSILSSRCVAEYDGIFIWPGIDRFLIYNGVVRELPNNYNHDWFYDNVNMAYRQKCWSYVNPYYGEIWFHFPFGTATECTHAVVYNIRGDYWYDTELPRYGGEKNSVIQWPILIGPTKTLYQHEYGLDAINTLGQSSAIQAYYETSDFAWPTTGPMKEGWAGEDRWTKLLRVEPDFARIAGPMSFEVYGRKYAQDTAALIERYDMTTSQVVQDLKHEARLMYLRFESNTQGGDFQAGEILAHFGVDDGGQGGVA